MPLIMNCFPVSRACVVCDNMRWCALRLPCKWKALPLSYCSPIPLLHAVFMHLKTNASSALWVVIFAFQKVSPILGPVHRTNLMASLHDVLSKPPTIFHEFLHSYVSWALLFQESTWWFSIPVNCFEFFSCHVHAEITVNLQSIKKCKLRKMSSRVDTFNNCRFSETPFFSKHSFFHHLHQYTSP